MMVKRVLFISAAGAILIALLMSCTTPGMSDVEFAKELMVGSAEDTGLYDDSMTSKSDGSTGGEPPIQIEPIPPDPGLYSITFTNYTPGFAPNSVVNGTVVVTLSFDQYPDPQTLTIAFDGELFVKGEHAGTYIFDAELIIDLSTGEYTYSGDITIDNKVYKTG
jgi:hypothetical protein